MDESTNINAPAAAAGLTGPDALPWLLSVVVPVLGALVALAWMRHAGRDPQGRGNRLALLLAAATLGTTVCASMVLSLASEALAFGRGYRPAFAAGLWALAAAGSLAPAALTARRPGWAAAGGIVLAAMVIAIQVGWVEATGFRPGVEWDGRYLAAAAGLTMLAFGAALHLASSEASRSGSMRRLVRFGAAALVGLALVFAQELVKSGAGLADQVDSVYRRELPAAMLALAVAVALPLLLAVMAIVLQVLGRDHHRRRRQQRRAQRAQATGALREPHL